MMTGKEYADLIAAYVLHNLADRSVTVYREVPFGKTIIGKNRCIDVFVFVPPDRALAVECKFQGSQGTTDEKIPYTLDDLHAMEMPAVVAYAGEGWSSGVRHMLASSPLAAYCLPDPATLTRGDQTRELDHHFARHFGWWDLVIAGRQPFQLETWRRRRRS